MSTINGEVVMHAQNGLLPNDPGLRVVSFDASEAKVWSQLQLLTEFMGRWAKDLGAPEDLIVDDLRPADFFHWMGGAGWGGLCALLFGRLRLTLGEVKTALFEMTSGGDQAMTPANLRNGIQAIMANHQHLANMQLRGNTGCNVVVYIQPFANPGNPQPFRSYPGGWSYEPVTFLDVACATVATITSPANITNSGIPIPYSGAALGFGNPMRLLMQEVRSHIGYQAKSLRREHRENEALDAENIPISLLLSLGAGRPAVLSLDKIVESPQSEIREYAFRGQDSERVNEEYQQHLPRLPNYLRLSVDKGLEDTNTMHWKQPGNIMARTKTYHQTGQVTNSIDTTLESLHGDIGSFPTLQQVQECVEAVQTALRSNSVYEPPSSPPLIRARQPTRTFSNMSDGFSRVLNYGQSWLREEPRRMDSFS